MTNQIKLYKVTEEEFKRYKGNLTDIRRNQIRWNVPPTTPFLFKPKKGDSTMAHYTIKIEKTSIKMIPESKDYKRIHEREEDCYGYVTVPAMEKEVTEQVFLQQVSELDLAAVIMAINKAPGK